MNRICISVCTAVLASTVVQAVPATAASAASAASPAGHFANCTAMHKTYPHGVGKLHAHDHVSGRSKPVTNFKRSNALYAANSGSDRDHDGIACEAH